MDQAFNENRNYNTISPSAKSLLLMKGYTNIPYAKDTAALMEGPEAFGLNFRDKDFWFWARVMHFESRYWSIDQLLQQTDNKNILELSSGYSLRGLDWCTKQNIHYIDTDLPEIISTKRQLIAQVAPQTNLQGELDLVPLNAMVAADFIAVANKFTPGAITIVNEGLLMYLNMSEKIQLCKTIYDVLKAHGGYWITADVYVKRPEGMRAAMPQSKSETAFFEQHNIEENKFDSYEQAASFFESQGFEVVKEANIDFRTLSVMPYLVETLPPEFRDSKESPPKIQATWMLKVS